MPIFYLPIEKVKETFAKWGFDDKVLHLDPTTAKISERLDRMHQEAKQLASPNVPTQEITFPITAWYKNGRQKVDYRFKLYYNVAADTFKVRALNSKMDQEKHIDVFTHSNTWRHSDDVYKLLVQKQQRRKAQQKIPQLKKIHSSRIHRRL